ncbi:unnamed protein product, partial [Mesorhabditis spiculigera]
MKVFVSLLFALLGLAYSEKILIEAPIFEFHHQCHLDGQFYNETHFQRDEPCLRFPRCSGGQIQYRHKHEMSYKIHADNLENFAGLKLEISPTSQAMQELLVKENQIQYLSLPQAECFGCPYVNSSWTYGYPDKAKRCYYVPLNEGQRQRGNTTVDLSVVMSCEMNTEKKQGVLVETFDPSAYKAPSLKYELKTGCATLVTSIYAPILARLEDRRIKPNGGKCVERSKDEDPRIEMLFSPGTTKSTSSWKHLSVKPALKACKRDVTKFTFPSAAFRFSGKNDCEKGQSYEIKWFGKGYMEIDNIHNCQA